MRVASRPDSMRALRCRVLRGEAVSRRWRGSHTATPPRPRSKRLGRVGSLVSEQIGLNPHQVRPRHGRDAGTGAANGERNTRGLHGCRVAECGRCRSRRARCVGRRRPRSAPREPDTSVQRSLTNELQYMRRSTRAAIPPLHDGIEEGSSTEPLTAYTCSSGPCRPPPSASSPTPRP